MYVSSVPKAILLEWDYHSILRKRLWALNPPKLRTWVGGYLPSDETVAVGVVTCQSAVHYVHTTITRVCCRSQAAPIVVVALLFCRHKPACCRLSQKKKRGCLAGIEKNGVERLSGACALMPTRQKQGSGGTYLGVGALPRILRYICNVIHSCMYVHVPYMYVCFE